jgi:hypothetical protein
MLGAKVRKLIILCNPQLLMKWGFLVCKQKCEVFCELFLACSEEK